MAVSELESFVRKFTLLCKSGITANLQAKTHAGKVWVSLDAELGPVQPSPHHRHHGPSREKRLARRAAAREKAAAQAAEPDMAAEQAAGSSPPNPDAAAQAVLTPASTHAAAQVAVLHTPPVPAAQAGHPSHEQHADHRSVLIPAVQAGIPFHVAAVLHGPPDDPHHPKHNVSDIPQLDGSMPSNIPGQWSCKCCRYETFFHTEDHLQQHHGAHMMSYEECNICFTGHEWIPRM